MYLYNKFFLDMCHQIRHKNCLSNCIIHRLYLFGRIRLAQGVSCNDAKQSDREASVMLELLGMQSVPSLPLHPGLHWPGVVASERALSMAQIELYCIITLNKNV